MTARTLTFGSTMIAAIGLFVLSGGPVHAAVSPGPVTAPTSAPTPAPTAAAAGPALDALRATVKALDTTSHNVTMTTQGSQSRGSVDPVAGTSAVVVTQDAAEFDETVAGGTTWVKLNIDPDTNSELGISAQKWMLLDPTRLAPDNTLPIPSTGADPIDMPGILASVRNVTQIDPQHFRGTLDLTAVSGRNTPDPEEVAQAGAAATAVPFTATADASLRITEFKVDASGFDSGLSLDVTYSGWGNPSPVATPLAAVPAPDDLYDIFTN